MNIVFLFILCVCGVIKFGRSQTPPKISNDCVCGAENLQQKVVGGGELSVPNKYPWLVSLAFQNGTHFCGAAIINRRYLLTAAHCFEYIKEPDFLASFGAHNVTLFQNRFPVKEIIRHQNYSRTDFGLFNDIALIKMEELITFSRNVQPICLPKKSMTKFDNLVVAGWGYISPSGPTSDVAKELNLPPVTNEQCYDFHGDIITPYQMCAGGRTGEDSCSGDSGGPLMSRSSNTIYQAGVVSYGIGCARPGYYGIYSRVSMFLDWIYDNTPDASYCLPRFEVSTTTELPSNAPTSQSVTVSPVRTTTTTTTMTTRTPSARPTSPPKGVNEIDCGLEGKTGDTYPWIAAIYYNEAYFGSAVLVTKKLMLTTGTNLMLLKNMNRLNLKNLKIVFGDTGPTTSITSIKFHPRFGRRNVYDNNFVILTIDDTSFGNENLKPKPICLPELTTKLNDGTTLKTIGWKFKISNMYLQEGTVEIVNRIRCSKTRRWITGSMICGKPASTDDSYLGNTGGPAMVKIEDRWYLGALVLSISRNNEIPVVYSDVRYVLGYIYQFMRQ